ncbi:MAG: ADP-ribosylation factor-like protein [Candidatus Hermodarchaeota archaeon]
MNPLSFYKIAVTGLDFAGKSTILKRMILGRFIESQRATPSLDIELIEDRKTSSLFEVFDLSGQLNPRSLIWEPTVAHSEGIIFVIDSSSKDRLEEADVWFHNVLDWCKDNPVVLFLINKIDLPDRLSQKEITKALSLDQIPEDLKDRFKVFEISAKTGVGVKESFQWFMEKVAELKTPHDVPY